MEVNARLQVEHPVTEAVTGLDLVKLQLHVAGGGRLEGEPPEPVGHAIEARLNAEDPAMGFSPTPGRVQVLDLASGPGVRVDRGIAAGDVIPPDFDSMVAKVIAYGRTRDEAIARLSRALRESTVIIEDGTTNRAFLLAILDRPEFKAGEVDIAWLDRMGVSGEMQADGGADAALLAAAIELADQETATERASFYAFARRGRPEATAQVSRAVEVRHRGQAYRIVVSQLAPGRYRADVDGCAVEVEVERLSGHERRITIAGTTHRAMISRQGADLLVEVHGVPHRITRDDGGFVRSHGPSVVVAVPVSEGDEVAEGDVVAVVESMKMETSLTAPFAGRVRRVLTTTNVQVPAHTPLLQLEAIEDEAAEQAADRVDFAVEAGEARGPARPPALDAARLRRLGRRGPPLAGRRCARRPPALSCSPASTACSTSSPTSARSAARATTRSASCCTARRSTCTPSCARSTPRPSGCPSASSRCSQRALAHYGVESLDRTPALEEACYRLFVAHERADSARAAVVVDPRAAPGRVRRARRGGRRRVPRRARPARAGHGAPRSGDRRPGAPAAQPLLRPARDPRSARPRAYEELECHLNALHGGPQPGRSRGADRRRRQGAAAAGAADHRPPGRDERRAAPRAAGDHDPPLVPRARADRLLERRHQRRHGVRHHVV